MEPSNRDHDGEQRNVQTNRFLDIDQRFVIEARENGGAAVGAERDRLVRRRRNDGAKNTARAHDAVGVFDQGIDRKVDAFQP